MSFGTFGDRRTKGTVKTLKALIRDHLVRSGGMLINMFLLYLLTEKFGLYYLFSQLIGIGGAMLWNWRK
ncbi:hypothetical protein C9439_03870 [archaeon SCG-AAA382B04]|nr:hypothetical protein C9439_03870 [archaeon SCG-AAA382B04]